MSTLPPPRTYNQNHIPRAHTGGRRISIYWTWSYPWEAQRDPSIIENRFSTMTEVRNVLWPAYETEEYNAANFLQGVAGTLELFHRPAHRPSWLQTFDRRADPRRHRHADGVQTRHHDVGFTDDYDQRQVAYLHHGDRLVPRQQRFSQYTRSLMRALDVPVHNIWGLRPAVVEGTKDIAPLTAIRDLDTPRLLDDVTTFNFHPHRTAPVHR